MNRRKWPGRTLTDLEWHILRKTQTGVAAGMQFLHCPSYSSVCIVNQLEQMSDPEKDRTVLKWPYDIAEPWPPSLFYHSIHTLLSKHQSFPGNDKGTGVPDGPVVSRSILLAFHYLCNLKDFLKTNIISINLEFIRNSNLLTQNLHCNKISRLFVCPLKFEKHCFIKIDLLQCLAMTSIQSSSGIVSTWN